MSNAPSNGSIYPSFKSLVKGAWEATAGSRPRFFTFVVLFVFAYSIDLLVPWAMGYTLGVFVQHGFTDQSMEAATWGILAYVGLKFTGTTLHHFARYLQQTVAFTARMKALSEIFASVIAFPLSWHVNHHSGENLSRIHRSANAIESTIGLYVWQILEGLVKVLFASIALFTLDLWVAINVLAMAAVTVMLMILFNKRLTAHIRRNNAFYDRLNRICVDYLFNIVTVKSLRLERHANEYLTRTRVEGLSVCSTIARFQELKWGTVGLGYSLVMGSSLYIYFSSRHAINAPFDVAAVYVLLNYLDRIFGAIGSFTGYYSGLVESSTAYEDATSILSEVDTYRKQVKTSQLGNDWKQVTIKELDFNYGTGELATGINAKSLPIRRGAKIALVGPSGGGKSTLLKILGGMLKPEKFIAFDQDNKSVLIESIADTSLILPQEPEIFSESVQANLTMGDKISDEKIRYYLSLCRAEEVLNKLPGGFNANLAEKGLNLSVGEKQRFAMTRGLLRAGSRQILLLDEPTSSLDPMTEKQIFYGLLHHFADRTVITACHRLALVPLFDVIVYVRRGQIEEIGSFKELLDRKGLFYAAWDDYEKKILHDPENHTAAVVPN